MVLMLALPDHAVAQTPRAAKIAIGGLISAHVADTITTLAALDASHREANPMLPQSGAGIVAVKGAVTAATSWALWRLADKHPRLVFWASVGVGATLGVIAARNGRATRGS